MGKFTKLNIGDSVASSGDRVWKKLSVESAEEESVVGTWVFNDYLMESLSDIDLPMEDDFVFYSNGNSYSKITANYGGRSGLPHLYYGETTVYGGDVDCTWTSEAYKTIKITSEPTDSTFIEWLKANATKQTETTASLNA